MTANQNSAAVAAVEPTPTVSLEIEQARQRPPRVTELSFSHPKNYLGVPLAVAGSGQTGALVRQHLVSLPGQAKQGAIELGLLTPDGACTPLGDHVVAAGVEIHGSAEAALATFDDLHGSPKRFGDVFPRWQDTAQRVFATYEPSEFIISTLRNYDQPLTLPELVETLAEKDEQQTARLFLRADSNGDRPAVKDVDLTDRSNYRGEPISQLKGCLFHTGIVTERGADTETIDPATDHWALEQAFRAQTGDNRGDER